MIVQVFVTFDHNLNSKYINLFQCFGVGHAHCKDKELNVPRVQEHKDHYWFGVLFKTFPNNFVYCLNIIYYEHTRLIGVRLCDFIFLTH